MLEQLPPIRAITKRPKYHWFGYYDELQFDPSGRFVLGMRVGFEHRVPTLEDTVEIGMVDLEDRDRWIPLDISHAWCWQQGCMLQWRPGSTNEIVWNDRDLILNDFYPGARHEPPYPFAYLYHVPSGEMLRLGEFSSPAPYNGELRIDLHPKSSPDGRTVIVDSAHAGNRRQMYLIDISEIVG